MRKLLLTILIISSPVFAKTGTELGITSKYTEYYDHFSDTIDQVYLTIESTWSLGGTISFVWTRSNKKPYVQITGGWFQKPLKKGEIDVLVRQNDGEIQSFKFKNSPSLKSVHSFDLRTVNTMLNLLANGEKIAIRVPGLEQDIVMNLTESGEIFRLATTKDNTHTILQKNLVMFETFVNNYNLEER